MDKILDKFGQEKIKRESARERKKEEVTKKEEERKKKDSEKDKNQAKLNFQPIAKKEQGKSSVQLNDSSIRESLQKEMKERLNLWRSRMQNASSRR